MQKLFQNLKDGTTSLEEVPVPSITSNEILVKSNISLISLGTEKMLINFSKSNFLQKALNQKDRLKDVKKKVVNEGLIKTFQTVNDKLTKPIEMGYSNVGEVIKVGHNILNIKLGDRIVSNSSHSEYIVAKENFSSKIPNNVSNEEASFSIVGAIALNAVRLSNAQIGETYAVIGMGLIGLLTSQILIANGCKVVGIDKDVKKLNVAKELNIFTFNIDKSDSLESYSLNFTDNIGFDKVIIASSDNSNSAITNASVISRKKGSIILIGTSKISINRNTFYKKELSFLVSSSYGPGRYDYDHENKNVKFPIEYIRWTAKKNIETFLDLLSQKKINVNLLITHRFKFENSLDAYKLIANNLENKIAILLEYKHNNTDLINLKNTIKNTSINDNVKILNNSFNESSVNLSFIGAGNYASKILIPLFKKNNVKLISLCSKEGSNAAFYGKKYNFVKYSSNADEIISEKDSNCIVVSTHHNSHAELVINALKNKKNIFVEKPLALNTEEIKKIKSILYENIKNGIYSNLLVGYNRRFSPFTSKIKELLSLETSGSKSIIYTINAGSRKTDSWINDNDLGGGRIIGEICHFLDLIRYIVNHKISSFNVVRKDILNDDSISINLQFNDNSIATIHYFANGHFSLEKERLEIFVDNKYLFLDNFIKLKGLGWKNFTKLSKFFQDKGQKNCINSFINSISAEGFRTPLIPYEEIFEVAENIIKIHNCK